MKVSDIHTHILPEVDDGSQSIETTCEMLKHAKQDEIELIFATPHLHYRRGFTADQELLERQFSLLVDLAKDIHPTAQFILGREVNWGSHAQKMLNEGTIPTMGDSNYVLLEFSANDSCHRVEEGLRYTLNSGYRVILAHADRYPEVIKNIDFLRRMRSLGVLIQLNTTSIMGKQGFSVKRNARKLLSENIVSFIASDTHDPTYRPMQLKKCAQFVEKKYGEAYAKEIFQTNPIKVARNEYIP